MEFTRAHQRKLLEAMAATRDRSRCFYNEPETEAALRDAQARGFVHRASTTQVHWTEAGVAALDPAVVAEHRERQGAKAAVAKARRERLNATTKAKALQVYAEAHLEKAQRLAEAAGRLLVARLQLQPGDFEPYLRKSRRGEIWVEVEGVSIPSPFKSKKAARVAVLKMVDAWDAMLSETFLSQGG